MENVLLIVLVLFGLWVVLGLVTPLFGMAIGGVLALVEAVVEARQRRAVERADAPRARRPVLASSPAGCEAPRPDADGGTSMSRERREADPQRDLELAILATLDRQLAQPTEPLKWLILSTLREDDFRFKEHRALFQALVETYVARRRPLREYRERDCVLELGPKLARTWKAVRARGTVILDPKLLEQYLEMIVLPARLRRAKALVAEVQDELERATAAGDPEACRAAIDTIQTIAFDLPRTSVITGEARPEGELVQRDLYDVCAGSDDPRTIRTWPAFSHLDRVLGGLRPGLYVFAGPPGCGKSAYLRLLGDVVSSQNRAPVLYFSFESSAAELRASRASAYVPGVHNRHGRPQLAAAGIMKFLKERPVRWGDCPPFSERQPGVRATGRRQDKEFGQQKTPNTSQIFQLEVRDLLGHLASRVGHYRHRSVRLLSGPASSPVPSASPSRVKVSRSHSASSFDARFSRKRRICSGDIWKRASHDPQHG